MKSVRGNALFLILIAVALFAALSYAVTQSGRGSGNIDRETLTIETAQIIQYIETINQAVRRLQIINGCSDTEVSALFDTDEDGVVETNGDDAYFNPNSPTDERCNIFSANGGGIIYEQPSDAFRVSSELTNSNLLRSGHLIFTSSNRIFRVGTDGGLTGNDLFLFVPFLSETACSSINSNLGITGTNIQESNIILPLTETDPDVFDGDYLVPGTRIGDDANTADLEAQTIACVEETGSGTAGFHLYSVLIAR